MSGAAVQTHEVYQEPDDDEEGDDVRIGSVGIDAEGVLSVLEAVPEKAAFLRNVVDQINRKPEIGVRARAMQDPENRFTVGSSAVARGEPDFGGALRDYLERYYGLRLS